MEQPTTNYLSDLEQEVYLVPADKGLRFVNWLIDTIVYYALAFLLAFVYSSILVMQGGDLNESFLVQETGSAVLGQYIAIISTYTAYYTIIEAGSKGRTLGKLITGTMVVRNDGSRIGWKDGLLRSLCRLIPFENLAALFTTPWHDSITNTMVVKKPK